VRHTRAEDRERARQEKRQRRAERTAQRRSRIAGASTPEAAMSGAFDWVRSSARRLSKPTSRSGAQRNRPAAERFMRRATDFLAALGEEMDEQSGDAQ
jgi:hypothetical protein